MTGELTPEPAIALVHPSSSAALIVRRPLAPAREYGVELLVGPAADPFFQTLVRMNVGTNYFQRTKTGARHHYAEGAERNAHCDVPLLGTALLVNCPDIEVHHVQDHVDLQGPLTFADLEQRLLEHEGSDGAHIVYAGEMGLYASSNPHKLFVDPRPIVAGLRDSQPEIRNFADVLGRYLPPDFVHFGATSLQFREIGCRTSSTMMVPILAGQGMAYLLKQTVFDHGDVGKVVVADKNGIAAEFFLAKADELSPKLRTVVRPDSYFDRQEGIVGVLRTYSSGDKRSRCEYLIPPSALNLERYGNASTAPQAPSRFAGALSALASLARF